MATAKKATKKKTAAPKKAATKKTAVKKAAAPKADGAVKTGRKTKDLADKIIQRPVYISDNALKQIYEKQKIEGADKTATNALYSIIGGKK